MLLFVNCLKNEYKQSSKIENRRRKKEGSVVFPNMPVRKWYWIYRRLAEQGGNSTHYEKIIKASREYYYRQMTQVETCTCGIEIKKPSLWRHLKTKKHADLMIASTSSVSS
jgi:hypothetical protein